MLVIILIIFKLNDGDRLLYCMDVNHLYSIGEIRFCPENRMKVINVTSQVTLF